MITVLFRTNEIDIFQFLTESENKETDDDIDI